MLRRSINTSKRALIDLIGDEAKGTDALDGRVASSSDREDKVCKYSFMLRSSSASNLCPGSWECTHCGSLCEPVGLGKDGTTCKVCHRGKDSNSSDESKLSQRKSGELGVKDDNDVNFTSWSDLGVVLDKTLKISVSEA